MPIAFVSLQCGCTTELLSVGRSCTAEPQRRAACLGEPSQVKTGRWANLNMTTIATLPSFGWTKEQVAEWNDGAKEILFEFWQQPADESKVRKLIPKPVAKPAGAAKGTEPTDSADWQTKKRRDLPFVTKRSPTTVNGAKAREWIAAQVERPSSRETHVRFGISMAHAAELITRKFGRARTGANANAARGWVETQEQRPTIDNLMQRFKIGRATASTILSEKFGDGRKLSRTYNKPQANQ